MKVRKHLLSVMTVIVLSLSLVLVGCSTESANNASQTDQVLELSMDKSDWDANLNKVGKLAAEKYGAGFKAVPFSDTTSFQATVKQSLQGNDSPDLFTWWSGFRMEEIVRSGKVADLTDEWKNYYEKEGLNPDLKKAFTFNGKVYAAPLYSSNWTVFYNKKLFDKYGLKEPKTWSEFLNICETLKQNGVTPIGQSISGRWPSFIWFEELLARSNPDLYEKLMVGKASYTDPGVVEVMKVWKEMLEKGYFSKSLNLDTEAVPELAKGKIGMLLMGSWYQKTFSESGLKPGEDYSTFFLPNVKKNAEPVLIFETSPVLVSENNQNKEQALAALRNFMKKDTQELWSQSQVLEPLLPGIQSNNPVIDKISEDVKENKYRFLQRYWEATPPEISEFAADQFAKFITQPNSYMDALKLIEENAKKYWNSR